MEGALLALIVLELMIISSDLSNIFKALENINKTIANK